MNVGLHRKTLSEQAYESIRDAIIHLRLKPGQMVYEAELSESLGMSRTPMREAFRMLLVEDLIEVLPQRGARISLISERKAEETRFVRERLEVSAIEQAARRWNVKDPSVVSVKRKIGQLLEDQQQALRNGDMVAFLQLDEQFHRALLELFGNRTLISVVSQMRGHLNRLRYLSLTEIGEGDQLLDEHRSLFEAVAAGDDRSAVRIMEKHLRKLNNDLPMIKGKFPAYFKAE
jgi:DNA-binding GntR family transcriptional regulator